MVNMKKFNYVTLQGSNFERSFANEKQALEYAKKLKISEFKVTHFEAWNSIGKFVR